MRAIIETIFGVYTPIEGVIGIDGAGQPLVGIPGGFAGVDWTYVLGVLLFGVVLYCLLRMIGGMLK